MPEPRPPRAADAADAPAADNDHRVARPGTSTEPRPQVAGPLESEPDLDAASVAGESQTRDAASGLDAPGERPEPAGAAGARSVAARPQPEPAGRATAATAAPAAPASGAGAAARAQTRRSLPSRASRATRDFVRRVYKKAEGDNIFFMAGAIAFNVLVAVVPLIVAVLGVAGLVLRGRYADPAGTLMAYLDQAVPGALSVDFGTNVRAGLDQLIDQSSGLLSVGTIFFVWVATRLVGTLRTALREIFDIQQDRGIIAGKIFDIKMVFAAGTLLTVNVAATVIIRIAAEYGVNFLGIDASAYATLDNLYATAVGFLSIWFMFVLIYRYLPARRIQWRIAVIAATFTGVFFELLKSAFSWYVANLADYRSTYGNFATVIILFLWIYYMAIIFIIGGEVGQVAALHRIRRRQKERLT